MPPSLHPPSNPSDASPDQPHFRPSPVLVPSSQTKRPIVEDPLRPRSTHSPSLVLKVDASSSQCLQINLNERRICPCTERRAFPGKTHLRRYLTDSQDRPILPRGREVCFLLPVPSFPLTTFYYNSPPWRPSSRYGHRWPPGTDFSIDTYLGPWPSVPITLSCFPY